MASFKLEIKLDSELMQLDGDVGRALIALGAALSDPEHPEFELEPGQTGVIRDDSGADVGIWKVSP